MTIRLVLDMNYLAHRAYYAMGDLEYRGVKTGVLFGVFRDIVALRDLHCTDEFVFCFDRGSKRYELYPDYKKSRRERLGAMSSDAALAYAEFRQQVYLLEHEYLPALGYANVFSQDGYEADDLIGALCVDCPADDRMLVVGSDSDFLQLLGPRVRIWNPRESRVITRESFIEKWGIEPSQWADVKALAGCGTDDVAGIDGVGEVTAAKFLRGELNPNTKTHQKIVAGTELWKRNLMLVRLPFPGVIVPALRANDATPERWSAVMDSLGMRSIREVGVA